MWLMLTVSARNARVPHAGRNNDRPARPCQRIWPTQNDREAPDTPRVLSGSVNGNFLSCRVHAACWTLDYWITLLIVLLKYI